jgi:hypothetical protein
LLFWIEVIASLSLLAFAGVGWWIVSTLIWSNAVVPRVAGSSSDPHPYSFRCSIAVAVVGRAGIVWIIPWTLIRSNAIDARCRSFLGSWFVTSSLGRYRVFFGLLLSHLCSRWMWCREGTFKFWTVNSPSSNQSESLRCLVVFGVFLLQPFRGKH